MTLLEKIYDLAPNQSQVLYSDVIGGLLIEVREYETYRWLQIGGDSIQGLMDIDTPEQVLLPNIQALLLSLLFCPQPKRVLNLGFGCGSVERFLKHHYSNLDVSSLEENQQVIQLAKQYFFVPNEVDVINNSAELFLANNTADFDIILCDIFNDEEHPSCLYEDCFYADLFSCLDDKGVLAINLLPESEDDVIEILSKMKNYFGQIALLEVPNHFNAILYATNFKLPNTDELDAVANDLLEASKLDVRALPQHLNRLMESIIS